MALTDLKFEPGLAFEAYIWKQFGVPVNHLDGGNLREFFMVAEICRSKLRINNESVSLILQSCFGGHASRFKVSCLQNWSFKFSVSSKDVGFAIIKGGNYVNDLFIVGFFLWGHGGPDFRKEYHLYLKELEQEWTLVDRSNDRRSYAATIQTPRIFSRVDSPVSEGNPRVLSVLERLVQSMPILNPVLTSPNNVALGRAESLEFQKSGPGLRYSHQEAQGRKANFCVCCLSSGHLRPNCTNRIRCRGCKRLGHIRATCHFGGTINALASEIRAPNQPQNPTLADDHGNRLASASDPTPRETTIPTVQSNQPVDRITAPAVSHSHRPTPPLLQLCSSSSGVFSTPAPSSLPAMVTFPFDLAPFLPVGCHAIKVEGQPARHRVIHGNLVPSNEDLAIVTIIPMPQGEVAFTNVREILQEFLQSKRMGVVSITRCPFGQVSGIYPMV